jgi:nucleotide-binding universal stress UspA family protein
LGGVDNCTNSIGPIIIAARCRHCKPGVLTRGYAKCVAAAIVTQSPTYHSTSGHQRSASLYAAHLKLPIVLCPTVRICRKCHPTVGEVGHSRNVGLYGSLSAVRISHYCPHMPRAGFKAILHPTDFSHLSGLAFAHALRIALASKAKLHLIHVTPQEPDIALAFPHARRLLAQWGFCDDADTPSTIERKLGVSVYNTRIRSREPVQPILQVLRDSHFDLVVLATQGGKGIARWLKGSVAELIARHARTPTLFVAPGTRPFIRQVTGDIQIRRAIVPIDSLANAGRAIALAKRVGALLAGADITLDLLHVGHSVPPLPTKSSKSAHLPPVMLRAGSIVKTIVDTAIEFDADFIAMATAGHRSALDPLLGSTTERVVRHAPCPVFAIPRTF